MSNSSGFVETQTPITRKLILLAQHGYHGSASQFGKLFENLKGIDSDMYDCPDLILRKETAKEDLPQELVSPITLYRTAFTNEAIGPIAEQADDIKSIIKTLKEKYPDVRIVLLGHSKGGLVNMHYAITYPGNINGLISIGTPYNFNIMGFVQGLLDDILRTAKNVSDFLSIDELKEKIDSLYERIENEFVDDDLGNPEVVKRLKLKWNSLPKGKTPKLFTIGACQMGKTSNYKGGGDLVVAASSQVANGYQKVYQRFYVKDNYINLKIDEFLAGLSAGTLIKIITVIKQTIYYATNDIFEKVFKLFLALTGENGAFPEYDLIHTRECDNLNVAKYIDSVLDTLLREENQDNNDFEPVLSEY